MQKCDSVMVEECVGADVDGGTVMVDSSSHKKSGLGIFLQRYKHSQRQAQSTSPRMINKDTRSYNRNNTNPEDPVTFFWLAKKRFSIKNGTNHNYTYAAPIATDTSPNR